MVPLQGIITLYHKLRELLLIPLHDKMTNDPRIETVGSMHLGKMLQM